MSLDVAVPMTNMEGGGGTSPAPSPASPQDQPTDLRVPRGPEGDLQPMRKSLKRVSPPPLTALPLGLARAPSSFMIGDILRQQAQGATHSHDHRNGEDDDDDDEEASHHVLSRQGK